MDRYELLAAARSELRRMAGEQNLEALNAVTPPLAQNAAYAQAHCEAADDAIFAALNVLASYRHDERAVAVLHATDVPMPA